MPRTLRQRLPNFWKRFQSAMSYRPQLLLNAEGSIVNLTPSARHLLEYPSDAAVETCFFSHVHQKNLFQVMRDIAQMVTVGMPRTSWLLRLRTGRRRYQWFKADVQNRLDRPERDICVDVSLITPAFA